MRVLIVEDEPIIALEIESLVLDRLPDAKITLAGSVCEAIATLSDDLAMAFLDIDVTDGKTYPLALELRLRRIPFVFVSGADRSDAPEGLAGERLIPKPFSPDAIMRQLDEFVRRRDGEGS